VISKKAVVEFKKIHLQEFGILLSKREATEKATALLELFKVLAKKPCLTTGRGKEENEN
tara:strand:- start:513 stop:689 length:177 start_codon:yes stop_codon:yes gene_type:complete